MKSENVHTFQSPLRPLRVQVHMTPESIRAQVRKIIASRALARSERLARFLDFTVNQTLTGRADELKEFVIGVEVFDRAQDYDPRLDPIVRVEARRLRMKLRKYYETEGSEDWLYIEYPKGSYAPAIRVERGSKKPSEWRRAIAVLPFAHPEDHPECEYVTDGLTEELISALTKVDGLRVVAWNSSLKWRATPRDYARIGDELNVDVVLEGSVKMYSEGWARVSAQLVSVRDVSYLWTGTYERPVRDVLAARDAIAAGIARALRVKLSPPRPQTQSLEAFHAYLKGRHHWNKRTDEGVSRAIECVEMAIAADPNYALAHVGLADSHIVLAKFGAEPACEAMPKARRAALRALELDPTLAEAHVSLGSIAALFDWDWAAAEKHYRRGLEINPGYATGHQWYAHDFLFAVGRLEEAEVALARARQCDPLSIVILSSSAENMLMQRKPAAAVDFYNKAIDLDPYFPRAYFGLSRSLAALGKNEEAIAAARHASSLISDSAMALALESSIFALAGRRAEADEKLEALEQMALIRRVSPYLRMRAWMSIDAERACDFLEQALDERDPRVAHAAVSPVFDPIRNMRRYESVVRRMGLAIEGVPA